MKQIAKAYNHQEFEKKIYEEWERKGYFKPEVNPKGKPFCIIMPPPNANGSLHLGHAVFVTLEDLMTRFARLNGKAALWLPGADHAGFETQVVFEKKLEKEGRNRFEIPRNELYKETFEFTQKNKKIMEEQLKRLGASCDWSRDRFTLDQKIIKIVYETFKKLYEDGLAYRDVRPVNWCTRHQTSLSDLEVKFEEQSDPLYYIKYGPLTLATVRPETKFGDTAVAVNPKDKRYQEYVGKEIEIETVLGKSKIKVIADDYVDPKFGTGVVKITPAHDPNDFEVARRHNLPIVEVIDQYGRMNEKAGPYKGMKVLEARKAVVFDMQKKGLINKIDENYVHQVGKCYKCNTTIEPRIIPQWFIAVSKKGEKSGKNFAKDAINAVKKGEVKFVTPKFEKIFNHWMKNIRDWNISRQIVWGIRIPAWYCENSEKLISLVSGKMGFAGEVVPEVFDGKTSTWRLKDHNFKIGDKILFENSAAIQPFGVGEITDIQKTTVSKIDLEDKKHYKTYKNRDELIAAFKKRNPEKTVNEDSNVWIYTYKFTPLCEPVVTGGEEPKSCPICSGKLHQDPDVFDTWFSSGQWPYATLKTTGDFEKFYPTSVMETAWDILFFWVARMIMFGLYETGQVPFKDIYLHGLVRDKDRKKMSKSKGNVIDPLGVSDLYGPDAVRMALVFGATAGNDVAISEEKIKGMRNFANKVWNASRFVLLRLTEGDLKTGEIGSGEITDLKFDQNDLSPSDARIWKKHQAMVKKITKEIQDFKFSHAGEDLYHYFWHDFADIYIEEAKALLENPTTKETTKKVLFKILRELLVMIHPFMPFVTEAVWQELRKIYPDLKESIMIADWPKAE